MDEDRAGPLGCGCALLPGLVLGLVLFVGVALALGPGDAPAAASAQSNASNIDVALSEEYLSRLVVAALGGGPLEGLEVDAKPGNRLAVRGQAVMKVLGRSIGMPVSFAVVASVRGGALSLALAPDSLPEGLDTTQTAGLNPMLVRMAVNLQRELERALGGQYAMVDIVTDEESVLITLAKLGGTS